MLAATSPVRPQKTHLLDAQTAQTGSTTLPIKRKREAERDESISDGNLQHEFDSESERQPKKTRITKTVEGETASVYLGTGSTGPTLLDSETQSDSAGSENESTPVGVDADVEAGAQPQTGSGKKRVLTAFEEYLESQDLTSLRFPHHSNINFNDEVLLQLTDKTQNDVIEHTGDGLHNVSIADVLQDAISSSELTQDWPTEQVHACIEALSTTYAKNDTIGRIFCRMYDRPLPKTWNGMKAEADSFEALTYWIVKTHGEASLIKYYEAIVDRTLEHAIADFLASYSTCGSDGYLNDANRYRTKAFREVFPKHEQAFLDALEPYTEDLTNDLAALKMLRSDPPIVFDEKKRVIGVHRPMDFRGRLLFNQIIASEIDFLFPSHQLAGRGGSDLRTQMSRLATCQGALTLLARLAGLGDISKCTVDEDRLPSMFFVALFMLKERDDIQFEKLAETLSFLFVFVADAVLFEEGICFDVVGPTQTTTTTTTTTATTPA
ncbi:hypothetical protein ONZ45_g13010 [Pleurotus djamor]|nr:hypothetical protein ONZ45_g13010 [Pleurotus djamor]